ncbi:SDR family oxidoreductase [Paracoccus mutanolyticus]|uniref:SDR family oxidoreductase n=1 Tax=Paracoccus mutanolyticus TaxID=1499308 RepID=UPI0037C6BB08
MHPDRTQAAASRISALGISCDVANAAAGQAAMSEIVDKLGAPHVLVNCAGIAPGCSSSSA